MDTTYGATTYATTAFATTAPWQSQFPAPASSFYYETGTTQAKDADSKDSYANWCLIVLIGVLLIGALVVTAIAAVTLSRRTPSSGTDAHDYELLVGGDDSEERGVTKSPPFYVVQRPSTPRNITGGPAPTVPTPLAQPLTVCTLAPGAEYMYIPDDGLCDYSFLDSLAITPGSNSFAVTTQSADTQRFVAQGQVHQKTRYGMSVSLGDVVTFSNAFRSGKGKTDYESYWKFNVYHWGFLHIDELQADAQIADVSLALTTLKEMHEHALSKAGQTPGTFLGIYTRTYESCATVAGYIRTIFVPTGVIVLGHLSYGDSWRADCTIMPPINYMDPRILKPGIGYGHSMRDAMHAVACLWNQGVHTSLSVSVTMQARRYKLESTGQGQALYYTDCGRGTYQQRTTAQEICDDPNSGYSRNIYYASQYRSPITYDDADGYAITFENAISLRRKLCDAWNPGAIPAPVGLAVYDANYDRRSSRCDRRWINGTWSRFHFLIRLRDFLHQTQPSSAFLLDCHNVT